MRFPVSKPGLQHGAALLAFMLVLIVTSAYYLVTRLNANLQIAAGEKQTRTVLAKARQALIGYAVSYPDQVNAAEGPGYLPCPDTDKDGDAEGSCSASGPNFTTTGRLPYKTLELEEVRDSSGQRLWYILSENFRNNPKLVPLNSESPASAVLSVNGTGDIVAVIIAPGEPLNSQNRDPAETSIVNEIGQYLDGENADLDSDFVTRSSGDFNDVVTVITRSELMTAVEKRVLGELARVLAEYEAGYGAYPWLTPFADPKADRRALEGTHNGGDGSAALTDTSRDFILWGVTAGDMVRNTTDGSIGTITSVTATSLGISGGLQLGSENDFDNGDGYVITAGSLAASLKGVADGGSAGNVLVDTGTDFNELGITAGDIVENLSDTSGPGWAAGMVESVDSATRLTVKSLSGGSVNVFTSGDNYSIRSNQGETTGGSSSLVLEDTDKDFSITGLLPGDTVINLTDGSFGRISAVVDGQTLEIETLYFGSDNTFATGDNYVIPRFNTDSDTREGLLSFHRAGEMFTTAFDLDFTITADSGDVAFDAASFPDTVTAYRNALETHVINYISSGSVTFDATTSSCEWLEPDIADCRGMLEDYVSISGRVTAGNNTSVVTDSGADFNTDGVKRGDIILNYDDESLVSSGSADAGTDDTLLMDSGTDFSLYEPYSHVIQNNTQEADEGEPKIQGIISRIIDANTVEVEPYLGQGEVAIEFNPGDSFSIYKPQKMMVRTVNNSTTLDTNRLTSAAPDFDEDEYYRIIPATGFITGVVDSTSPSTCTPSDTCTIIDMGADFINTGIAVGDIVENWSDAPHSYGEVLSVTATTITTRLYGGGNNFFLPGENYSVYFNYAYSRRYEFHPRFRGNQATGNSAVTPGVRQRDVCLGYNGDCTVITGPVSFSGNGGVPLLTVRDYEQDGTTEVGRATFLPTVASGGMLKASGIDYYLAEKGGDLPEWLIKNKWHQLLFAAYADAEKPGGGAACTPATDCLTLSGAGAPDDNKRALVLTAGETLAGQDRGEAAMNDYYEGDNNSPGDDVYQKGAVSGTFNDQVRVIDTAP